MRHLLFAVATAAPASASAQSAVVYYDSGYSASAAALAAAGVSYTTHEADGLGFQAGAATADLLIVEVPGGFWTSNVGAAVASGIAAGKAVILHHWAYDVDPTSAALLSTLGIAATLQDSYPSDLFTSGSYGFFGSLGGALLGGQDLAGYNNTYFNLNPGAGDVAATNAAGWAAIVVVNGGNTIVNGYLPFDWQYTDLNGNGLPDGQDVIAAEIDHLLNGRGLTLAMTGSCPGPVMVDITGGTPGGAFGVVRANNTGSFAAPSGPCAGTVTGLGVSGITLLATPSFSSTGELRATPTLGVCGKYYQIVDLTTCATSLVVLK